MKVNAYVLAADPAWIEASVLSYYDLVGKIVVSYDAGARGWTGVPLESEECLRRLRQIDRESKLVYLAGHFAREEFFHQPMVNETYQRQCALDVAGEGADWVIQLDTDEIVGCGTTFHQTLKRAHAKGTNALNYPSLWLYVRVLGRWFLEWGGRGWTRRPSYPGPIAVRAGTRLTTARRGPQEHYHVDLTSAGSPTAVPNGIAVDEVVPSSDAIWHLAMVRTEAFLRLKIATSGHAYDRNWNPEIRRWLRARRSPLAALLTSQLQRGPDKRPLRLARIPAAVATLLPNSVSDESEVGRLPGLPSVWS